MTYILAIETSFDETAVAVLRDLRVLSNAISSQIEVHKEYGGVVPNLARREHLLKMEPMLHVALKRARVTMDEIDAIVVTQGPGLAPSLEVGLEHAKKLSMEYHKPLVAVNHLEGHLLSCLAQDRFGKSQWTHETLFPAMGLIVSGGHTQIVYAKDIGDYELLGETRDDAAGEAFDKLAKMMSLGYPGGPIIEEFAKKGDSSRFKLPRPMEKSGDCDMSFSGLKTACLYLIRDLEQQGITDYVYDLSASFQAAVAEVLWKKLEFACHLKHPKTIVLGGGAVSNIYIRSYIRKHARKLGLKVAIPYNKVLFTDNAAMIGVAGYFRFKAGKIVTDISSLDRKPNFYWDY